MPVFLGPPRGQRKARNHLESAKRCTSIGSADGNIKRDAERPQRSGLHIERVGIERLQRRASPGASAPNIDRVGTKHCKQPASLAAQARTDNASGSIARIEHQRRTSPEAPSTSTTPASRDYIARVQPYRIGDKSSIRGDQGAAKADECPEP